MIEPVTVAYEFYGIQAIDSLKNIREFTKSHEKWHEEFQEYKNEFYEKLVKVMFDYTILACAGEMRHSRNKSNLRLLHWDYSTNSGRGFAMKIAKLYTPQSLMDAFEKIFDCGWVSGYGGKAWLKIAKSLHLAKTVPAQVYIDHCFDLCHNNGPYFNKEEAQIFNFHETSKLNLFLGYKRYHPPVDIINQYNRSFSRKLRLILFRALNLSIIPNEQRGNIEFEFNDTDESIQWILEYTPIIWGTHIFNSSTTKLNNFSTEDKDEQEEEEQEEYREQFFYTGTTRRGW